MPFDAVVACDWSSEQGRKPTPQENRCWLAWGTRDGERSEPEYVPTRAEAEDRIRKLLGGPLAGVRTLVGFDFAIGYPLTEEGEPVLPSGRDLCAMLAERITDDRSGVNNRFEVAAELNCEIRERTSREFGPFWGCPRTLDIPDLPMTRPSGTGIAKLRPAEVAARKQTKTKPKSAWQLAGIGSVGGQSLVGLPAVHRLLTDLGDRAMLWPFDEPDALRPSTITIAEIYPSMFPEHAPSYWYKDARQVVDTRDALLDDQDPASLLARPEHDGTGWILGLPSSRGF